MSLDGSRGGSKASTPRLSQRTGSPSPNSRGARGAGGVGSAKLRVHQYKMGHADGAGWNPRVHAESDSPLKARRKLKERSQGKAFEALRMALMYKHHASADVIRGVEVTCSGAKGTDYEGGQVEERRREVGELKDRRRAGAAAARILKIEDPLEALFSRRLAPLPPRKTGHDDV